MHGFIKHQIGYICHNMYLAVHRYTYNVYLTRIGAVALTTGFTNGAGQIWLDNVQCRGTETRLIDCPRNALGSHNCVHAEDAGVNCPGWSCNYASLMCEKKAKSTSVVGSRGGYLCS